VATSGSRVLLSGHWGDQVLFSSAYLVDLFRHLSWGELWRHTREYPRWFGAEEAGVLKRRFLTGVVRYHVPDSLVPPLKWIKRRLSRLEVKPWFSDRFLAVALRHANQPATLGRGFHSAHARSLYLEARSKYHVQCLEWNNKAGALYGLTPAFPFLDRDLLAYLMAVPGDAQNRGGVPRALLRDAMRGVLPDQVRERTWKADFTEVVNDSMDRDKAVVRETMTADCLGVRRGYFDAGRLLPEVARLSASLRGADNVNSWELADLYGFEVWLQVFWNTSRANLVPLVQHGAPGDRSVD
jgi:asparagine synthase (glutamine-hydrolysing)